MKVLGVDYGDMRTGFSISDESAMIAVTLEVLCEKSFDKVAAHTANLAERHNVSQIVIGFPRNMDGSVGERGKKSRRLSERVTEIIDIPVILWDERLTTISAHRLMNETNIRGQKRKSSVDKVAAAYILQSYLDSNEYRRLEHVDTK